MPVATEKIGADLTRAAVAVGNLHSGAAGLVGVEEEVELERGERGGGERDCAPERVVVDSGVVAVELLLGIAEARWFAHPLALARAAAQWPFKPKKTLLVVAIAARWVQVLWRAAL